MILLCAGCATLAVLLSLPSTGARSLDRRLLVEPATPERSPSSVRRRLVALAIALALVVAGFVVAGGVGAAVGATAALAGLTTMSLVVRGLHNRAAGRARTQVAHACSAIAAQVRVGRVPLEALASTTVDHPVLDVAHRTAAIGGDPVTTLRAQARAPGHGGLDDLARAWALAAETGAPMAGVLDQVAASLRADLAVQRTLTAELAGPRASSKVLAALPFCGVAMGYLLGGDPVRFLLGGPGGWACLVGGVGLACGGVLWIDRLARAAEQL